MTLLLQTSVAVGDIQEVRQNALLRQRELHVSLVCIVLAGPYQAVVVIQLVNHSQISTAFSAM